MSSMPPDFTYINRQYKTGYYIESIQDDCSFDNLSYSTKGDIPKTGEIKAFATLTGNFFRKEKDDIVDVNIGSAKIKDINDRDIKQVRTRKYSLINFFRKTIDHYDRNQLTNEQKEILARKAYNISANLDKDVLEVRKTLVELVNNQNINREEFANRSYIGKALLS